MEGIRIDGRFVTVSLGVMLTSSSSGDSCQFSMVGETPGEIYDNWVPFWGSVFRQIRRVQKILSPFAVFQVSVAQCNEYAKALSVRQYSPLSLLSLVQSYFIRKLKPKSDLGGAGLIPQIRMSEVWLKVRVTFSPQKSGEEGKTQTALLLFRVISFSHL